MHFNPFFRKSFFILSCTIVLFGGFGFQANAASEEDARQDITKAEKQYDPTPVIMEHIADSHDWHLWGHTSIGLPVILKTAEGLVTFNSDEFHHDKEGMQVVATSGGDFVRFGNKIYHADASVNSDGQYVTLGEDGKPTNTKPLDFSITKNVASMFLSVIIICLLFISVASSYAKRVGKAPQGLQSVLEPIIVFVRDEIAKPNIGHKYARYMPFLLTVFFFIWINNLLGLIPLFPGGANVTGNIAVTFVLGTITFLVVNFSGNKHYWKHIFMPSVPLWLYPIMWIVELIGILSKPFALIVRLFANITAGHIIILSLISLIFMFKDYVGGVAPVSVLFVLFMNVLELLVAFLQAFIFTLLTALFIGSAVEEHAH